MIPAFAESGLLPDGIHWADMNEIRNRYGHNVHRQRLMSGLARALKALRSAGCSTVYLDVFDQARVFLWEVLGEGVRRFVHVVVGVEHREGQLTCHLVTPIRVAGFKGLEIERSVFRPRGPRPASWFGDLVDQQSAPALQPPRRGAGPGGLFLVILFRRLEDPLYSPRTRRR